MNIEFLIRTEVKYLQTHCYFGFIWELFQKWYLRPGWLITFAWIYGTVWCLLIFYASNFIPLDYNNSIIYYCSTTHSQSVEGTIYLVASVLPIIAQMKTLDFVSALFIHYHFAHIQPNTECFLSSPLECHCFFTKGMLLHLEQDVNVASSECVYLSANRFSMAWEKRIQVPYPFFVFAWHWKTDLNFAFCFSFSPNFEKRYWTSYYVFRLPITLKNGYQFQFSFFVFASLWKTDMNFVFRFRITLKNGFEFRFSFSHHFEKQIWISFIIFAWLEKRITTPVQSFEAPATSPPPGVDRGIHFLCNWK